MMEEMDFIYEDEESHLRFVISMNIRKYREEKGLTQTELGEHFGKAKTTVASWEGGKSLPDAGLLYRLSKYLGVAIDDMYKESNIS